MTAPLTPPTEPQLASKPPANGMNSAPTGVIPAPAQTAPVALTPTQFSEAMAARHERCHPNVTVRHYSPNYSSRSGSIRLIVIHATESPRRKGDLANLGAWFGDPSSQVSAHVATDANGESGRYVDDVKKAWHVCSYNSTALGIEQIGWSADKHAVWEGHHELEICETARWVARWSKMYGIPIRKARVGNGRVFLKGVARHSDLGSAGGNHGDPGDGYPMERMFQWARYYRARI